MSVVVDELEVVPADSRPSGERPPAEQEAKGQQSPEAIRAEVERALAIRRERAERLRAT